MSTQGFSKGAETIPCLVALGLSFGSLLIYLAGALVSRFTSDENLRSRKWFNLAIPSGQNREELFAISIVSAQTTLSTVFIFFLTSAGNLGPHLLFCPATFALGLYLMFFVYKRVAALGHLDQSVASGVIPYLGQRMTNSRVVGGLLLIASILPLAAIVVLELVYGIPILLYLLKHAFSASIGRSPGAMFIAFAVFMVLLLGYVFIGGFRAVLASDVWQYRTMQASLLLILCGCALLAFQRRHDLHWASFHLIGGRSLVSFYLSVAFINLFAPLCLATTWQRFRAFRECSADFDMSMKSATRKAVYLWVMLISIGVLLQAIIGVDTSKGVSFEQLLNGILGQNNWFAWGVLPLITVAAFSGMYSNSDTCVSALIYLVESGRSRKEISLPEDSSLQRYSAMLGIFALIALMYPIVTSAIRSQGLMTLALAVFGNAIVIAPTVILFTRLGPLEVPLPSSRGSYIIGSILSGVGTYWVCFFLGLRNAGTVVGLLVSAVPAFMLLRRERRMKEKRPLMSIQGAA